MKHMNYEQQFTIHLQNNTETHGLKWYNNIRKEREENTNEILRQLQNH